MYYYILKSSLFDFILRRQARLTVFQSKSKYTMKSPKSYSYKSQNQKHQHIPRRTHTEVIRKIKMRSEIELQSICYERLLAKDESEIEKLVEAVTSRGVFFLDTSDPSAAGINSQIPQILEAQYEFFRQPLEYKQTFEVTGLERGSVTFLFLYILCPFVCPCCFFLGS